MNTNGYVVTATVSSIKSITCDEVWLITRGGPDIVGTIRVRSLSPSPALFSRYNEEWKNKNPRDWWHIYEERFNQELNTEEKLEILRKLWLLVKSGKIIALVCFCPDSRYCHRTLVGGFLKQHGIKVVDYNKEKTKVIEFLQPALF